MQLVYSTPRAAIYETTIRDCKTLGLPSAPFFIVRAPLGDRGRFVGRFDTLVAAMAFIAERPASS